MSRKEQARPRLPRVLWLLRPREWALPPLRELAALVTPTNRLGGPAGRRAQRNEPGAMQSSTSCALQPLRSHLFRLAAAPQRHQSKAVPENVRLHQKLSMYARKPADVAADTHVPVVQRQETTLRSDLARAVHSLTPQLGRVPRGRELLGREWLR